MANEKELRHAMDTYNNLCKTLDEMQLSYEKDEDKMIIHFGMNGDDLPMNFGIVCDPEYQLIRLLSLLPFKMSRNKMIDGAIATSYINYRLADGSFDFDVAEGRICFRMTSSFRDSLIGKELFQYMLHVSCITVDKYNDQFLKINEGTLSVPDFIKNN